MKPGKQGAVAAKDVDFSCVGVIKNCLYSMPMLNKKEFSAGVYNTLIISRTRCQRACCSHLSKVIDFD
jgi:hypothetical protein